MKKPLIAAVISLSLCLSMLLTACSSLTEAGDEATTEAPTTNRTEVVQQADAVAEYFVGLLESARAAGTGLSRERRYEINDLNIVSKDLEGEQDDEGNQKDDPALAPLNAAAKEMRGFIAGSVKSDGASVAFGEAWDELAPVSPNPAYAVDGKCEVVIRDGDDGAKITTEEYSGSITFSDEDYPLSVSSVIKPIIPLPDEQTIRQELQKISAYLTLEDFDAVFAGNRIEFSANRLTDRINSASYVSEIRVTAHAKGVGSLEKYGELTVFLTLVSRTNYGFDWTDPNEITTEEN